MIELTLPYPPSVNHYKRLGRLTRTKSGKIYQPRVNTDLTKQYFWKVLMRMRTEGIKSFHGATISAEVDVYPPDKRKRDLDGILKVLLDAMQHGGLYDDDNQISRLVVTRMDIIDQGQIIVRISEHAHPRAES